MTHRPNVQDETETDKWDLRWTILGLIATGGTFWYLVYLWWSA